MRVWITGVGVVSPLASTAAGTMRALLAGERAQAPITLFDASDQRAGLAAEVRGLSVADVAPRGHADLWSRSDAMAFVAAKEALDHAKLAPGTSLSLIVGGTTGGMFETEVELAAMAGDPGRRIPRPGLVAHPISATADRLHESLRRFDRRETLCSACSSGANAIALADAWIRAGSAERVLAGATDALCRLTFVGFNLLGAMDPGLCKPFDAKRAGLNLGEAAAFLLLESEASARARGAEPLAELSGWAIGAEASHITQPSPGGETPARLMRQALARARIEPRQIGYVNAHGTATPHNDSAESAALHTAFGDALPNIPVSSCKGQIGHTLGAAGAIEAAVVAMALAQGEIPPTVGLTEPDAQCNLRHVVGKGVAHAFDAAISNSFGFGGSDTVLVLAKPGRFEEIATHPRAVVVTGAAALGPRGLEAAPEVATYLEAGPAPAAGSVAFTLDDHLDFARARRLDDTACRLTATTQRALEVSHSGTMARDRLGIVAGVGLRVGGVARFLEPIFARGWRSGKPAVFPNLLISSPAGHASIYLTLRGPAFTTSDLAASSAAALAIAAEILVTGEADAMVACAVAESDPILDLAFGPVCLGGIPPEPATDGASALLLEPEEAVLARGASALARVAWWSRSETFALPSPSAAADARVVAPRFDEAVLSRIASSSWASVPRLAVAPRVGAHEAVLGVGLVAAVGALQAGVANEVLVLDRASAILLTRWC